MSTIRNFGWKRQAKDRRDWKFVPSPKLLAALPSKTDLTPNMGNYLDQLTIGCCGPHTAAACIEFNQKVQGLPVETPSRNFIYYNTRDLMGTVSEDSGVDNRSLLKSLAVFGFCPEKMHPYDPDNFTSKPSNDCYQAALKNRITNYAAVQQTLDQMKACIVQGDPFVFGFDVFQSMMTDEVSKTGVIPDPTSSATAIGGHDMALCGYDDNGFGKIPGGAFKLRQSWKNEDGSLWGDNGYGYISYKYATGPNASDFWVINSIPGSVVPPSPSPAAASGIADMVIPVLDAEFVRLAHINPAFASLMHQMKENFGALIKAKFPQ